MMSVNRTSAYTTPRPDIFDLVPATAIDILDVGCSNGALGRSILQVKSGRRVSGIEIDERFSQEAAQQLSHVTNADLNTLNWQQTYGDSRFDCIIFADVLEHLVDPQRCLEQARQYLRKGGCVIVSLPNVRHLSSFVSIFLCGEFPRRDRGIFDRTHLRWFTISDANTMLTDSGFRVDACTQALRWGDHGGGRYNRILNKMPIALKRIALIREFLTYQICIRAHAVF